MSYIFQSFIKIFKHSNVLSIISKNMDIKKDYSVSFSRRVAAFSIDILVINIFIVSQFSNALSRYIGGTTLSQAITSVMNMPSGMYMVLFIISILALLYFTFFEYYIGQTVGDMLLGIRTISLKEDAGKISLWSAALRNCYVLPFFPFYIFWVVEPLHLAFYKERFLEKITFTKTISARNIIQQKEQYKEYKLEKVK